MVRFIEADEYANGKRFGIFEFTMAQTKEVIDLIQDPYLYADIKMTLEQLDTLIAKIEKEPERYSKELIENLYNVRAQYAYQRPITTSP